MFYREFEHLNMRISKCCRAKIVDFVQRDYTDKGNPGTAVIFVCTGCGKKITKDRWLLVNVGQKIV